MATKIRKASRVGAVVLAAGSSSRMGEPKQLLQLADGTLLERALENLQAATVDEIVLVLGFSAETIRHRIANLPIRNLRILVNPDYSEGIASSLRVGLAVMDENVENIDATFVVLSDQPFIRAETFNKIIDQYRRSEAHIVVPMFRGIRGNPVLLDRSVFHEVMALQGDMGCRAIFNNHLSWIVKADVDDIGVLLDIDSKEDYERLRYFVPGQDAEVFTEATREARTMLDRSDTVPRPQTK
jgi:molybdenum cofactor cytidylyltransferase